MIIENALAGIAVKDVKKATQWYERLLDRAPDHRPMPVTAEWLFPNGGWVQVFQDPKRAGHSSVTLAVDDLAEVLDDLESKDIATVSESASDKVRTAIVKDPDGNQIVFAQALSDDMAR